MCRTYWYPLYAFIRRQGHTPEDAEDLTQGFFARLLETDYLVAVDPAKGRFRSFLLAAIKHFLSDERDKAAAQKRGGGRTFVSLNELAVEEQRLVSGTLSAERAFDRRWAMTLLEGAQNRLRTEYTAAGKGRICEA